MGHLKLDFSSEVVCGISERARGTCHCYGASGGLSEREAWLNFVKLRQLARPLAASIPMTRVGAPILACWGRKEKRAASPAPPERLPVVNRRVV